MRLISMEKGGNLSSVYARLVKAVTEVGTKLKFSRHPRLGFLTFCPTNLGTTIRASVHARLPKLSADYPRFEEIASMHNLQVRKRNSPPFPYSVASRANDEHIRFIYSLGSVNIPVGRPNSILYRARVIKLTPRRGRFYLQRGFDSRGRTGLKILQTRTLIEVAEYREPRTTFSVSRDIVLSIHVVVTIRSGERFGLELEWFRGE